MWCTKTFISTTTTMTTNFCCKFAIKKINLWLLLVCFICRYNLSCVNADGLMLLSLPDDFQIIKNDVNGVSVLVWTASDKRLVRIGNARPEFRIGTNAEIVVGYPREDVQQGTLLLPITNTVQRLLNNNNNNNTTSSQQLSVWSSGRRLDRSAPVIDKLTAVLPTISQTPTIPVDPTRTGPYNITRTSYKLSDLKYNVLPFVFGIEVLAEVTYPSQLPNTKIPFVMFLHGRHSTCYKGRPYGEDSGGWPCRNGYKPIPSHLGYRYVANILASNGYIVVSISANSINGQDGDAMDWGAGARSALIRHHLHLWSKWTSNGGDPWNNLFFNKVNMNKTVLVGHSRGGEGVHKAAIDTQMSDPYTIVGLVSYGPTAFINQVTPNIHSVTILPTCDGDVDNLQGQLYIDKSRDIAHSEAIRSAVISIGSNHNYFNTEWTPGLAQAPSYDDWYDESDVVCGSVSGQYRLTIEEQQVVGTAYTMALIRLAVDNDISMLQLLDGSYVKPTVVGQAEIATHAVGGAAHRYLYTPVTGRVLVKKGMKHTRCEGYNDGAPPNLDQCDPFMTSSPHWEYYTVLPSSKALRLQWSKSPEATVSFVVPVGLRNLTGLDTMTFRIANNPESIDGASLKVMIQDNAGTTAILRTSIKSVYSWPSSDGLTRRIHARSLRASLISVPNINMSNIVFVHMIAQSSSGLVWVLDIAASQNKIKCRTKINLPLLSVQNANITITGNGKQQKVDVNITSNMALQSPGAIWCFKTYTGEYFRIRIPANKTGVVAQVPYYVNNDKDGDGNYSFASTESFNIMIGALRGVFIGEFFGGVQITSQ